MGRSFEDLNRFRAGEPIRAEDLNAIVDALRQLSSVVGEGIAGGPAGLAIASRAGWRVQYGVFAGYNSDYTRIRVKRWNWTDAEALSDDELTLVPWAFNPDNGRGLFYKSSASKYVNGADLRFYDPVLVEGVSLVPYTMNLRDPNGEADGTCLLTFGGSLRWLLFYQYSQSTEIPTEGLQALLCSVPNDFGQATNETIYVRPGAVYAGYADEDDDGVPDPTTISGTPVSGGRLLEVVDWGAEVPKDSVINDASVTASLNGETIGIVDDDWGGCYLRVTLDFPATECSAVRVKVVAVPAVSGGEVIFDQTVDWLDGSTSVAFVVPKWDNYRVELSRTVVDGTVTATHEYNRVRSAFTQNELYPRLYRNDPVPVFPGSDGTLFSVPFFSVPGASVIMRQFT